MIVTSLGACAGPPEPRNVVLITLDTFRADALGVYGDPGGHSPNIDALAEEATVFDNAVTPIGTTFPAHASLFTGLYPKSHGVRWNGDGLADRFTTLAELLHDSGYRTGAFVSVGTMLTRGRLHQGFASVSDVPGEQSAERWHARTGDEVNSLAWPWLDAHSGEPFFLWLHYFETHSPYRPTPYAKEQHARARYEGVLAEGASAQTLRALGSEVGWTAAERAALRALYDGHVIETDRLVGEAVSALRARDLLGETLLVLTADHGQALGEHDDVGHGFLLWQPVLHVPLIVRLPGAHGPRRIDARVGLIDLAPTILDLLGLTIPPGLDGRSFAAAFEGKPPAPRGYFAEVRALGTNQFRTLADTDRFAVFDRNLKGIWGPDGWQVFDLQRDPQELAAAEEVDEQTERELLRAIAAYRRGARDADAGELGEEIVEELRALGYIQ